MEVLLQFTAGREFNEFKDRTYIGAVYQQENPFLTWRYFYASLALASFSDCNVRESREFFMPI